MDEKNFCFWLDGYLKAARMKNGGYVNPLRENEVVIIEDKLRQCFSIKVEEEDFINDILKQRGF